MDFLLQTILSYLLVYKYTTLFTVTLLAAIALPIPSAATLMASAAFASQGYFNMDLVILTASAGNILGDSAGFWLARRFGQPVLRRIGFRKLLDSPGFKAIERRIQRGPALIIFFSRFEVLATLSVNFITGLGQLPYLRYLLYEVPGEIVQVLIFASIGYAFGSAWEDINNLIGKFSLLIALALILLTMTLWKKIINRLIREK